jgi:hypothetical protein
MILDAIANQGGTSQAFTIDTRPPPAEQLATAFENIMSQSCTFVLPTDFTSGSGFTVSVPQDGGPSHPETLFFVNSRQRCGRATNHAFEAYADPTSSRRIIGCPNLCDALAAGAIVQLQPECQINPNPSTTR